MLHRPHRPRSIAQFAPPALLALAVFLYAVYFSLLTIERYHAFEARALDLGNLHQAIWNTAHGDWFRMTNQELGLTSRLSMHVEPILLPIAGLYRLFPGVETLLILQATVVALGALPLYALARSRGLGDWVALAFAAAWLLNPTIQAANWLEFHPVTLAPTFLMAAFYFLVSAPRTRRADYTGNDSLWFALFAALAAACKEEIGLLVAMMGLYAVFFQGRRRFGLITFALGAGWSLFAVLGIQAAFAGGNIHWGRYAYLGETTQAKLISLITRPDLLWSQLQAANLLRYCFELLLPVGFLSLLAPEVLLLALPSLAINLLADFAPMHQATTLIYAAPIIPFVLLSAVMGAARLQKPSFLKKLGFSAFAPFLALYLLTFALLGQRLYGYLPSSNNALPLQMTAHHAAAQAIIDQIPADAVVSAQDRLNPHVAGRSTVYIFPRIDDADTVLLDVTGSAWPQHPNDLRRAVDDLLQNGFGVAAAADGYLLLSKEAAGQEIDPNFYTAWQAPAQPAPAATAIGAHFGDDLRLDEIAVHNDRYGELVIDMTWSALRPLDRDLRFYVALLDPQGNLLHDTIFYQPVSVLWYPTSMWQPGRRVQVQTLPWQLPTDQFVLAVGVFAGEDGWTSGQRLSVTQSSGFPVLEDGTLLRLGGFTRTADDDWGAQPALPLAFAGLSWRTLDINFGEALRLRSAGLPATLRAAQPLSLALTWQRSGKAPATLSRFVHLLDAGDNKVAQVDGAVTDAFGPLPPASWPPDTQMYDLLTLTMPTDLPPGDYTLVAGWYDWQSGQRLPANGAGARADGAAPRADGAALLGSIQVVE